MDWSAIWTELPKSVGPLVGTVVGGLLAITGGVIGGFAGQYFTHRYTRRREAEKLIREKAEQLIHEIFAHIHWLALEQGAKLFRQSDHDEPPPLFRALAIQRLYFPELHLQLDAMEQANTKMLDFILTQRREQLNDPQAWAGRSDIFESYAPISAAYSKSCEMAVEAVVAAVEEATRKLRPNK
jgi:hypothetical protein